MAEKIVLELTKEEADILEEVLFIADCRIGDLNKHKTAFQDTKKFEGYEMNYVMNRVRGRLRLATGKEWKGKV